MTTAELAALYPAGCYYAYRPPGRPWGGLRGTVVRLTRGYPLPGKVPRWLRWAVKAASSWLQRHYYSIPRYRPGGRLLDVGAGAGEYLAAAAALGWTAVGVEANAEAAQVGRDYGLNVVAGEASEILRAGKVPGPFDVVRLHHTLEHLPDPAGTLRAAAALTRPGGLLSLAVPNAGGALPRVFGRFWYHWALPFHQSHFDVKALRELLAGTGWRVRRIYCVSSPRGLLRSLARGLRFGWGLRLRPSLSAERVWERALRPVIFLLDFMRLGDNLVVEAVKD